jgi:hypothetical protein
MANASESVVGCDGVIARYAIEFGGGGSGGNDGEQGSGKRDGWSVVLETPMRMTGALTDGAATSADEIAAPAVI